MVRPFQFSMRRLFVAMALFCVTAWLTTAAWRFSSDSSHNNLSVVSAGLLYNGSIMTFGAGVGVLVGCASDGIVALASMVIFTLVAAGLIAAGFSH